MHMEISFFQGILINKWQKEHLSHLAQRYSKFVTGTETKANKPGGFWTNNRWSASVSYLDFMPLTTSQSVNRIKLHSSINTHWPIAQWEEYSQQSRGPGCSSCVHPVTADKSLKWSRPLYSQKSLMIVTDHIQRWSLGAQAGLPGFDVEQVTKPLSSRFLGWKLGIIFGSVS